PSRVRAELEHRLQRRRYALHPRLEAGALVRSDVQDDAVRPDRAARLDRPPHGLDRLLVEVVLRAGQVDEVERVDEHRAEPGLLAPLAERSQVGGIVVGESPRARALDEELESVGTDLLRTFDRLL